MVDTTLPYGVGVFLLGIAVLVVYGIRKALAYIDSQSSIYEKNLHHEQNGAGAACDAVPLLHDKVDTCAHLSQIELRALSGYSTDARRSYLTVKDVNWSNTLTVFINGQKIELVNPDPSELLVSFIRNKVGLKGTKLGCEEGGCGACTVMLTKSTPTSPAKCNGRQGAGFAGEILSVNSCLRPLCINDGMAITTVEGVGSVNDGMSLEQERLVEHNGTQCGYCTPGWITNMHALNEASNAEGRLPTEREIEDYLDGNICRCTGYKPIVQAFQTFSAEMQQVRSQSSNQVHGSTPGCTGSCSTCPVYDPKSCDEKMHGISHPQQGVRALSSSVLGDVEDMGIKLKKVAVRGFPMQQQAGASLFEQQVQRAQQSVSQAQTAGGGCCGGSGSARTQPSAGGGGCCGGATNTLTDPRRRMKRERDLQLVSAFTPQPLMFYNPSTQKRWVRPLTLEQLNAVLLEYNAQNVQIVGGNTSIGVTKYLNGTAPYETADDYSVYVDVNLVPEMNTQSFDPATGELTVGATTSLNQLIALLRKYASSSSAVSPLSCWTPGKQKWGAAEKEGEGDGVDHSSVFSVTAHHLSMIANTQVRNAGTWAGNFMIFLRYPAFPSDAILSLTTAGAVLQVSNLYGEISSISLEQFVQTYTLARFQSEGLTILSLKVVEPALAPAAGGGLELVAETFKIAQRARNAHAHVNAGFVFYLDKTPAPYARSQQNGVAAVAPPKCVQARVVFGAVSAKTFIAHRTEAVLTGAATSFSPFSQGSARGTVGVGAEITQATLSLALAALQQDLAEYGGGPSKGYGDQAARESIMQGCLYRSLLRCFNVSDLPSFLQSALDPWVKPVTRGTEVFVPSDGAAPIGKPVTKLEAPMQATGQATYPSDETVGSNGLYAALVYSSQCAVTLKAIDFSPLFAPGAKAALNGQVVAVYTAEDIPGANDLGGGKVDYKLTLFTPLGSEVPCVGAPLAVVVADCEAAANTAVAMVKVSYGTSSSHSAAVVSVSRSAAASSSKPIANIDQAIEAGSFYHEAVLGVLARKSKGSPKSEMLKAKHRSSGRIYAGGQYHMYMEAQSAVAQVEDGGAGCVSVVCGTQDPSNYQSIIAGVLALPEHKVVVKCARTGGGFGGKLTRGMACSAAAALASSKLKGRPVRIFNTRTADMHMQSGREPWVADYEVGYSEDGAITALCYTFYLDAGINYADTVGGVYMGMLWADNAYYFPNYAAEAKMCYTNTPARTSMRAPGVVQSCFITETIVQRVAAELNLPPTTVQARNFITDGQTTINNQPIVDSTLPTVWSTLLSRSRYDARAADVKAYNGSNMWRKKGIAVCPVKYGMGWAGYNAGIQLGVRSTDGTVTVTHSGAEIGQGINTKVAQAVASALDIPISYIVVASTATNRVVNGGTTGGSGTSEVVCQAALNACATLNARLDPYRASASLSRGYKMSGKDWTKLLGALPSDVSLNCEGWYSPVQNPNGQDFQYFVYAACVTEIELDVLSGQVQVLSAEIVYDCGQSLNPAVDIGQIEGAFVMGLGYFLTEDVAYDPNTAMLNTVGTWEYKPPMVQDTPSTFNVTLLDNVYNKSGILGSKATGEPPYVVANSVLFAVKEAIASSRADAAAAAKWRAATIGQHYVEKSQYFELTVPATVEVRQSASLVSPDRFVMPM